MASPESPSPRTFAITSPAFSSGTIPARFTCDGRDASPPLAWTGVPDGARSLALLVDDADASGFVHWLAFGLPPTSAGVPEGASRTPAVPGEGRNDFGRQGWGGPCPPSGTHHYRFTLYALDDSPALTAAARAADLHAAIDGHVLATTQLVATYRRR